MKIEIQALIILVLVALNWPIFRQIANYLFQDAADMKKSVRSVVTPDIVSLFRGEFLKDLLGEAKLVFFMMSCIGLLFMEFWFVKKVIITIID